MIIDAVIPLLLEHGRDVTSRQIAEAAGIAEGTIFRAFGDKESLISAAVTAFMNGRTGADLESLIAPELALDDKLRALVQGMRHRVRDVMRMSALVGHPPVANEAQRLTFNATIAATFDRDRSQLRVTPEELGDYVRVLAIASSIPLGPRQLTDDELLNLIKHGLVKGTN